MTFKEKRKQGVYIHKTFRLWIFGLSIFILGIRKFSFRLSIDWGW